MCVKSGGGEDQNRSIDKEREKKRDRRIEDREAYGGCLFGLARTKRAGQHNTPKQKEIKRCWIGEQVGGGQEGLGHIRHIWPREDELDCETRSDQDEKRDDKGFELAETEVHEGKNEQSVERGQNNPGTERQAGEQFEADRGADDFGEIGRDDRQLHDEPEA